MSFSVSQSPTPAHCGLCAGPDPGSAPAVCEDRSLADHKRSRLDTVLGPPSPHSSPANTLPRRRKITRRNPAEAASASPRLWSGQYAGQ